MLIGDLISLANTLTLTSHSTAKRRPSGVTCLRGWCTGLTLRKYLCYNVKMQRFKLTNILTKSENYLHLQAEQLVGHVNDSLGNTK